MNKHIIKIDHKKCIGCGECVKDCPASNIRIDNKKAKVISQSCIKCGHCLAICPTAAVSITGFDEAPMKFDKQTKMDPNKLLDALRSRRSIRQFKNQDIPNEIIRKIIEAGRWTPTAKNENSVSYIVLNKDKKQAEKLGVIFFRKMLPIIKKVYPTGKDVQIDDNFFFKGAPTVILILSNDKISASLAASNMALMAESWRLGVLYSGFFTIAANMSLALRKELGLKRKTKVVTTLVLGYPNVKYHRTTQKKKPLVVYR